MATGTNNQLISVREAARECGRNPETVRRWIWGGKLPAEKLGNQLFIKRGDLASFCRLPARSVPAKAGETVVQEYKVKPKPDFLERAIALQNRIKARGGKPINAAEEIRKMREERANELEQRLREKATQEYAAETEADLLEHVREVRNRILARTGTLFDAPRNLKKLRKERMDELLHMR